MRFAVRLHRKRLQPRLLRSGVDPREAQRRSVEARRRRKHAELLGLVPTTPPPSAPTLTRRAPRRDSSHLHARGHTRPVLPETTGTEHPSETWLREMTKEQRTAPKPKFDPYEYGTFAREEGEPASDYWLRKQLASQEEWRRKQAEAGVVEYALPRLLPNPPDQYYA